MRVPPAVQQALGPMDVGWVDTDDNVQLKYQTFGEGPPVLFANGIGVRYPGAAHQVRALRGRFKVICWDYRGMGRSTMADPSGDITMPRHAADVVALLDHLELPQALLVGWSMGVQVSLELIRRWPERAAGFVALLGTYGRPFRTGLRWPLPGLVEGLFSLVEQRPVVAQTVLDIGTTFPRFTFELLSRLIFVGPDADREVFAANVEAVGEAEKALYLRTLLSLAQHDASDVLPQIRCPSLIICGERDYLTPPRSGRFMAQQIPGAQYQEISRGTHFALIEQAELINAHLVPFARQALGQG